jgi:hypothetical protein
MGEAVLTCVFTACWVADRVQSSPQPLTAAPHRAGHGPAPGPGTFCQRLDRGGTDEGCCSTSNHPVQLLIGHSLSVVDFCQAWVVTDTVRDLTAPHCHRRNGIGWWVSVGWTTASVRGARGELPLHQWDYRTGPPIGKLQATALQPKTRSAGFIPVRADCHPPGEDRVLYL